MKKEVAGIVLLSLFLLFGLVHASCSDVSGATCSQSIIGSNTVDIITSGTGNGTAPVGVSDVWYLTVGGGGGSGQPAGCYAGSGGAGGYLEGGLSVTTGTGYSVSVGSGGSVNNNGGDSILGSVTALGGGHGGAGCANGASGGSGGGAGEGGSGGSGTEDKDTMEQVLVVEDMEVEEGVEHQQV